MEKKGRNEKTGLKLGIVIVVLAVIVMAGFGSVGHAASGNTAELEDQKVIFNPFTLGVIQAPSDNDKERPTIRIPYRATLRSFFRPPLVTQTP
jgi:hypothetical protein